MGALRKKAGISQSGGESFSSLYIQDERNRKAKWRKGIWCTARPLLIVYDPENPDANKDGYVQKPNVDPLKEMVGSCQQHEII